VETGRVSGQDKATSSRGTDSKEGLQVQDVASHMRGGGDGRGGEELVSGRRGAGERSACT
jgi:hypothetical protein